MSRASVDHVILTRFNLPTAGVEGLIRAREGWLAERAALFERYTVPAVAGQTHRPTWLVYVDPQSPDWLLHRLRRLSEGGLFTPLLRESVSRQVLVHDLKENVDRRHGVLLTTNLDNDDGVARDFSERLCSIDTDHGRCVVYWPSGLIVKDGDLYRRTDTRNAFCSVREPWSDPVTAWSQYHNEFPRVMPVVQLAAPPGWLQVVHGSNVSNRVRGRLVSPVAVGDRFGDLLADARTPTGAEIASDTLVGLPIRAARDSLRTAIRVGGLRVLGKDRYQRAKVAVARLSGSG